MRMESCSEQPTTLVSIPPEVIIAILSQPPSFSDVFALAAVCRALRAVWHSNTTAIFKQVAPSDIKHLSLARSLLADQGGTPRDSTSLSVDDVRRMVRNARMANKSADRFGREVAGAVDDCMDYAYEDSNEAGVFNHHPPYLTPTERPRFIRAYYRLWGILELEGSAWYERYAQWTAWQLNRTCEMVLLRDFVGEEHDAVSDLSGPLGHRRVPDRRQKLHYEMQEFHVKTFHCIYGEARQPVVFAPLGCGKDMGRYGFIVIWDHYQNYFKLNMLLGLTAETIPQEYKEFLREDFAEGSSDEEASSLM